MLWHSRCIGSARQAEKSTVSRIDAVKSWHSRCVGTPNVGVVHLQSTVAAVPKHSGAHVGD